MLNSKFCIKPNKLLVDLTKEHFVKIIISNENIVSIDAYDENFPKIENWSLKNENLIYATCIDCLCEIKFEEKDGRFFGKLTLRGK